MRYRRWLTLLIALYAASPTLAVAQPTSVAACDVVLAVERRGAIHLWHAREGVREFVQGSCAALDRDARRLAYCTPERDTDHPGRNLHVRMLDGSATRWTHTARAGSFISEAAWSPDGLQLAFIETDAQYRSHVMLWAPGSPARRLASAPAVECDHWWSLGWLADGSAVSVHDMETLSLIELEGRLRESLPLSALIDADLSMIASTDRVLPAPHDTTVFAYTRMVPGTALFAQAIHEPNSALLMHDRFVGRGKNFRLTAADVTVIDVAWTPDGRSLYFSGYLDRHASENDPFRIYRIGRDGRGMRELLRGERVSVGCRGASNSEAMK